MAERGSQVDREKALDMALGQIEKQFGKGSIMKLGERGHVGIASTPTWPRSPNFMIEPLPNCLSIWLSAISSALSRSTVNPSLVRVLVGGRSADVLSTLERG